MTWTPERHAAAKARCANMHWSAADATLARQDLPDALAEIERLQERLKRATNALTAAGMHPRTVETMLSDEAQLPARGQHD